MLSKADILAKTLQTKEVEVKAWGGSVLITELTVKETIEIENIMLSGKKAEELNKKVSLDMETFNRQKLLVVSKGVVTAEGEKMFTLEEVENLPSTDNAVDELYDLIMEFNKPKK